MVLQKREPEVSAGTLSVRTYGTYDTDIRVNIKPYLGKMRLAGLKPRHIQEWVSKLLKEPAKSRGKPRAKSAATVRKARTTLSTALEYAVEWGFLGKNPFPRKLPIVEEPYEVVPWTEAETKRFLEAATSHRLYALFYLAIATGMRQGELLGLRWRDIDLDKNLLRIRKTQKTVGASYRHLMGKKLIHLSGPHFLGEPKTKKSKRDILLSADVIRVLAAHHEAQHEERYYAGEDWRDFGLVFPTSLGTPMSQRNLKRDLDKLIAKAEVPAQRFHDQRDLSASLLIAKGVDSAVISERLGHSRTSTTWDKYIRVVKSARGRAVMSLEEMLE